MTLDDFLISNILHLCGGNVTGTSTNHLFLSKVIALTRATDRQAKVGHFSMADGRKSKLLFRTITLLLKTPRLLGC